jgi:hypothetical protein
MDMREWTRYLMDMHLLDADFTKREGRLCFTMSKMLVADEVGAPQLKVPKSA